MKKKFLKTLLTFIFGVASMAQLSIMPIKAATNWNDFRQAAPKSSVNIADSFNLEMSRGQVSELNPNQSNMVSLEGKEHNKASALWAKNEINLTQYAKGESYIYLGNYDGKLLADGLTLTFHNDSRGAKAIGGVGQGIGIYPSYANLQNQAGQRIMNALVFEIDTFLNNSTTGSCYDHGATALHAAFVKGDNMVTQCSGEYNHRVHSALNTTPGFGYHKWVPLNFEWTPTSNNAGKMKVTLGTQVLEYPIYDVKSYFNLTGDDKSVYWGYTAATGDGAQVAGVSVMKIPEQAQVTVVNSVKNARGENVNGKGVPQESIIKYTTKVTETRNVTAIPMNSRITATISEGLEYAGNATYKDANGAIRSIIFQPVGNSITYVLPEELKGKSVELSFDMKVTGLVGSILPYNATFQSMTALFKGTQVVTTINSKGVNAPVLTVDPAVISLPLNAPYPDVMQGVSAKDVVDGDITQKIVAKLLPINTAKQGQYVVNYEVKNSLGMITKNQRIYVVDGNIGQNYAIFAEDFKIARSEVDTLNPDDQILQHSNARIEKLGQPGVLGDPSDLVVLNNGGYGLDQHAYIVAIGSKTDPSVQINVRAVVGYYGPIASANNIKVVSNNAYLTKVEGAEFAAKLLTDRKWAEQYIIERAKAVSWDATTKQTLQFQSVKGLEQINEVKKTSVVQLVTAAGDEYSITVLVDYANQTGDTLPLDNMKMKIEVQ